MSKDWPMVPLGQILTQSNETTELELTKGYRRVTIKLWGQGAILRDEVDGGQIAAKKQSVIRANQFVLSRIDARHGATAIVPESLDGAVVSNDFPAFNLNQSRILPQYLDWLSKTHNFVELCKAASEGTTNRVRLKLKQFLQLEIPLPPLAEQRRIVARIEELAAKIERAQALRQKSLKQVEHLIASKEFQIWPNESLKNARNLAEVTTHLARGRQSKQGESDIFLIKTRHVQMGQFVDTDMKLASFAAKKVKPEAIAQFGDVLIACSAAGCLGRVAQFNVQDKAAATDTHVAIARADEDIVLSEYLYAYLRGAQGQYQLRSRERGDWQREKIGFRLTELNMQDLQQVPVPVPPLAEQRRIVAYLDNLHAKVEAVKRQQAATAAKLNALLPSLLDKAFKGEL